jgi:RecB family exonuclease
VRRALAAEQSIVNVRFIVRARVAELLGAPSLTAEGQRPLTPWVRLSAVRAALAGRPGVFAAAQGHPSTARELGRTFKELRGVSEEALRALEGTTQRAADVVALFREYRRLTGAFFDETELLERAARAMASRSQAAEETGPLVLYLPRELPRDLHDLVRAASTETHAIFGLTGDAEVDAVTETMARSLGEPAAMPTVLPPAAHRIISATEPEEEVREAIRQAMELAAGGTPLHRIGFLFGSEDVYAGLLDDALTSAGIPHSGQSNRKLSQSIAGCTVLGLPRIAASSGKGDPGYARDVLMDWLTSAPIWFGKAEAPSHRWDEISREAGIVHGAGQWIGRLENYAAAQDLEADLREPGEDGAFRRNADWARTLAAFISELRETIGDDELLPPSKHAEKAIGWLDKYLPARALDDESELECRERVKRLLEEIAASAAFVPAALDAPIDRRAFAAALEDALASESAGRSGALGDGIFTGPLRHAGEMDFDAVVVLGMVEGSFPTPSRDDPLLTASERARTNGELPPGGQPPTEARRTFLAALHAARFRILSAPRADLRSQRATQPSRWLLESATALAGGKERIYATELGEMLVSPPAWFRVVHSFEAALRTTGHPASLQERDMASLLRYHGRIDRHFLMQPAAGNALARGRAAWTARARGANKVLNEWTGRVAPGAAPVPGPDRPISPTALEQFAACPFRYFLGNVLKVGEIERPEELVTIAPATIGNIVHEILEDFFKDTASRADASAEWTDDERNRLREFARAAFARAESKGQTGKDLTWRAEQARILRDLELLLERELRDRREAGYRFRQAEAAFGLEPHRSRGSTLGAAMLELPDGGSLAFRGKVDRVDEGPEGELLITDYKTGSTSKYDELTAANPLQGGKFLQLPVYALAFHGQSTAPVRARYWFISEQADFTSTEVNLDEQTMSAFREVAATLIETMRQGYFPAVPGKERWRTGGDSYEHCAYCPYDLLCPSSQRAETWEAARKDPGIIPFAELASRGIASEEAADA